MDTWSKRTACDVASTGKATSGSWLHNFQLDSFYFTHKTVAIIAQERCDDLERGIAESGNVEDSCTFRRLSAGVSLKVDANQLRRSDRAFLAGQVLQVADKLLLFRERGGSAITTGAGPGSHVSYQYAASQWMLHPSNRPSPIMQAGGWSGFEPIDHVLHTGSWCVFSWGRFSTGPNIMAG